MKTALPSKPRWRDRVRFLRAEEPNQIAVHALHKSATMFLFRFFQQVAKDRRIDFYSENLESTTEVVPDLKQSFCEAPIRTFDFDSVPGVHRIVHVRDPRDILVSEFFSFGWIHANQNKLDQRRHVIQAMSIDEYVLNQPQFSNWPLEAKFEPLLEQDLEGPDFTVLTYEQMVLDFPAWAACAIEPFRFRMPRLWLNRYRQKFAPEFEPKTESMTHRRKMTPGDHREKLRPKTIALLNQRFAPVLERFGYAP